MGTDWEQRAVNYLSEVHFRTIKTVAHRPLCPYFASNPTKTISAEPDHAFLILIPLFLNAPNKTALHTLGGNSASQDKEKKAKKKRFNKSNLFCQQLTSALLLLLKRHTMERPSEGHGEELQQTVRKLRT